MTKIAESRIAILATDGYERSELRFPLQALQEKGATVDVLSIKPGEIRSWNEGNWGDSVAVGREVAGAKVADYDALVLPGGQINPDILRTDADAVRFVRDFARSGKPVAAICHGPWLLVEADVVRGRNVTSYKSIRTDLVNAGAHWSDAPVVVEAGLVTSRQPADLPRFVDKIVEEIEEGRHDRSAA